MNEQEQDERIRAMARDYHEPPPVPRDRMWAAIVARRAEPRVIPISRARRPHPMVWITALAATFLLGIAIDRLVIRPGDLVPGRTTIAEAPSRRDAETPSLALQVTTTQYLSRMEMFLTEFRIAEQDSLFHAQARDLLTSTRLLLDSPALQSSKVRGLLEDLELILVQIVQPGASHRATERQLITDGLEQRQVLPRLRSEIPAGPPTLGAS